MPATIMSTTSISSSSSLSSTTVNPTINISTNKAIGSTFDPHDEDSWFFGFMSRADAADLLSAHLEVGAFLVRESTTAKGDLVLSVKENNDKISHYIINRLAPDKNSQLRFKIGDQIFSDIPALLSYYQANNLDDTPLQVPASPRVGLINLSSQRRSFTKDYLAEVQADSRQIKQNVSDTATESRVPLSLQRKLPSRAVVIQSRVPNAYDKTALALKEGQIVKVTKIDISGCWEGEIDGRVGHFPFNYVKFIEESTDGLRKTI